MRDTKTDHKDRRVVVIQWKENRHHPLEVYSNLKNFCTSYPAFNYNTLNNYLSKTKTAYENNEVRIERKNIISKAVSNLKHKQPARLVPVVAKGYVKTLNQDKEDLRYWLSRPVKERAAAVTTIISQSLKPGQRLDKSVVARKSPDK